ncbi:MAG TPA: cupin [Methanoregula sp.]|nr:cupin [Methanoregula sp.]
MKAPRSSGRHGTVPVQGQTITPESLPWNPHPKFAGVFLRHLVTGKDAGGRLRLHHVRIDPGCAIGDHSPAGQVEIHDVLIGEGTCTPAGTVLSCIPGVVGVMPAVQVRRVEVGNKDLLPPATFVSPLV